MNQRSRVLWSFGSFLQKRTRVFFCLPKKKQKGFYFRRVVFCDTGLGRKVIANPHLQGLARGEQLQAEDFCFFTASEMRALAGNLTPRRTEGVLPSLESAARQKPSQKSQACSEYLKDERRNDNRVF
jgi:hypothetical protein